MIIFEKPGAKAIKKFICKVGIENLDKIFDHFYADMSSKKPPVDYSLIDSLKSKVDEIIDKNENIEKQDLEINGNDMLALKIQQKQISKIKTEIYEKLCNEIVLIATRHNLSYGNRISPQFPLLVMLDAFYAYYLNSDVDSRTKKFSVTLLALDEQ